MHLLEYLQIISPRLLQASVSIDAHIADRPHEVLEYDALMNMMITIYCSTYPHAHSHTESRTLYFSTMAPDRTSFLHDMYLGLSVMHVPS